MDAKRELRGKIKGELRFFVNVALAKFADLLVREGKISPENACTESIHLEYEAAEAIFDELLELGFVRIEDVKIDRDELLFVIGNYLMHLGLAMGEVKGVEIADLIIKSKDKIIRVREGK